MFPLFFFICDRYCYIPIPCCVIFLICSNFCVVGFVVFICCWGWEGWKVECGRRVSWSKQKSKHQHSNQTNPKCLLTDHSGDKPNKCTECLKKFVLPLIRQELFCAPRGDCLIALMWLTAISICFLVESNNDDMFHSI